MKTDMQLQRDVLAELQWEPTLHAAGIGVEVADGVVTLAGHVGSYPEKWEAEKAAQRVSGVRAVAVDLEIDIADPDARGDADIAHAAAKVLQWMALDPHGGAKVLVEEGWIELTGELDFDFQRKAIVTALRRLAGVKGINSYLTLRTKVSLATVKSEIEAALTRQAVADAHRITVGVQGTEVTLSGQVGSWAERDAAQHAAWGTAGVHSVIDNTTVAT